MRERGGGAARREAGLARAARFVILCVLACGCRDAAPPPEAQVNPDSSTADDRRSERERMVETQLVARGIVEAVKKEKYSTTAARLNSTCSGAFGVGSHASFASASRGSESSSGASLDNAAGTAAGAW